MKSVRIYKDNLREHILRSLFLTDTVLFVGVGIIIAITQFVFFKFVVHFFQTGVYLMSVLIAELLFALVATLRVENQPLYILLPRAFLFLFTKKQYRADELESSTADFNVQGNYIIRHKTLIAVYEIEPFDIALLNEEDKEQFYQHIKMALHTLSKQIQLIVRKETARISDYHKHFFSIYKDADPKREELITQYIDDISQLIATGKLQIVKYYAVFSTHLPSQKEVNMVMAARRLQDTSLRFSTTLQGTNITMQQLEHLELVAFCNAQVT